MPGGRFELATNPEGLRGCSTAVNDKLRVADSSSVSAPAPALFVVHCECWHLLFRHDFKLLSQTLGCCCMTAKMLREPRVQIDARSNVNSDRLSRLECKPKPFIKLPGGRFELPTKGL